MISAVRQAGGPQDVLDAHHRRAHVVVVDDAVAVEVRLEQFPTGHLQPAGHGLGRFRAAGLQPFEQLVGVARLDEDRDRVGIPVENRQCTLHVDLEHHPIPGGHPRGDLGHERAVPVLAAVHPAALEKLAVRPPAVELVRGEEVVVDPVALPCPRWPRGGRDAGEQGRQVGEQPPHDRRLAHARGAGNDDEFSRRTFHPDVLTRRPGL